MQIRLSQKKDLDTALLLRRALRLAHGSRAERRAEPMSDFSDWRRLGAFGPVQAPKELSCPKRIDRIDDLTDFGFPVLVPFLVMGRPQKLIAFCFQGPKGQLREWLEKFRG